MVEKKAYEENQKYDRVRGAAFVTQGLAVRSIWDDPSLDQA